MIKITVMRILSLVLCTMLLVSCRFGWGERISGNGQVRTEKREVSKFDKVSVSGGIQLYLKEDASESLIIETDANLLPYIEVFNEDEKLVIRTKKGYNLDPSKDIIVHITAPSYRDIDASGSCDIIGEGTISADQPLSISVSGSGDIKMDVDVEEIKTSVSGSGNVNLRGRATRFESSISGSGSIRCFDLESDHVDLSLSGSAEAEVTANKDLDVKVSGAGDVRYKGNASVSKSISGAGSVKKVG